MGTVKWTPVLRTQVLTSLGLERCLTYAESNPWCRPWRVPVKWIPVMENLGSQPPRAEICGAPDNRTEYLWYRSGLRTSQSMMQTVKGICQKWTPMMVNLGSQQARPVRWGATDADRTDNYISEHLIRPTQSTAQTLKGTCQSGHLWWKT